MKQLKAIVTFSLNELQKKYWIETFKTIDFQFIKKTDIISELIQEIDIFIGNPPLKLVVGASSLKWIQLDSAGSDQYVQQGILSNQTVLCNASGAYGLAISEHMLGMALLLKKRFHEYLLNQQNHDWKSMGLITSIYNAKVLIVGLGDIGNEFAKRCKALGAYTIGIKRNMSSKPEYIDELYLMDQLDKCIEKADIIALSLPNSPLTYHVINEERLLKMKKGALLMNVGRGKAVDTEALCKVLNKRDDLLVSLDVTDPEPLPKDHPLWDFKNVVITPHISGNGFLEETCIRIFNIITDNLHHFVLGEELENQVDFKTGYRKTSKN